MASSNSAGPVLETKVAIAQPTRFEQLIKQHEIKADVAKSLFKMLSNTEIVLVCDDSGSMAEQIKEPNSVKTSTRWMELKRLAAVVIEYCTACNSNGLDLYFLNRGVIRGVTSPAGLQEPFSTPPSGSTPLLATLRTIYEDKRNVGGTGRQLLIIVVTDGCPSDGSRYDLARCLRLKPSFAHVSFAECTDVAADMEWLDDLDTEIPNFDNSDSYNECVTKVRAKQGATFKFDFNDYVVKILLATFDKKYFNLDQPRYPRRREGGGEGMNDDCCIIL